MASTLCHNGFHPCCVTGNHSCPLSSLPHHLTISSTKPWAHAGIQPTPGNSLYFQEKGSGRGGVGGFPRLQNSHRSSWTHYAFQSSGDAPFSVNSPPPGFFLSTLH